MKNVIVTGATGVTGNALVHYLLSQNVRVTALVRPNSYRRKYLPEYHPLLRVINCGMEDYCTIASSINDCSYEVFFHLAWEGSTGLNKVGNRNDFKLQNLNVSYAIDAVELCHAVGCSTFLMTGSQAEYGRYNRNIVEMDEKHPENGYGMAKLCAESMTRNLCKSLGIRHIWPILFSVYGPNDATESLIDTSIRKLKMDETLPYTLGEQKWDYIYSYDAAEALFLLAQSDIDGEAVNVANGMSFPLKKYIMELYDVMNVNHMPRFGEIPYSSNQVMYLGANIDRLKKLTGFEPKYSFEEGVKQISDSIDKEK